jgi:hypothetical protein
MSQHQYTLTPNIVEAPPTPPQRLQMHLPPPLVIDHFQQIPPACSWNLADILDDGVRHEQTIYGYLNSLLASIFLPSRRFQVSAP